MTQFTKWINEKKAQKPKARKVLQSEANIDVEEKDGFCCMHPTWVDYQHG